MKPTLTAKLLQTLAPWRDAPAWQIAYSGGLDSTVLLHLLADLAKTQSLPPLQAIHVHHGLQVAADAWPAHCQAVCGPRCRAMPPTRRRWRWRKCPTPGIGR